MRSDLRPLKPAEVSVAISADPLNRGELQDFFRTRRERYDSVRLALVGADRIKSDVAHLDGLFDVEIVDEAFVDAEVMHAAALVAVTRAKKHHINRSIPTDCTRTLAP